MGVAAVQVRIGGGHVHQPGIVGANGAGGIHQLVRRIGGRRAPVRHIGFANQEFHVQRDGVAQIGAGLGEPLPAAGFFDQVVERGVLEAAEAAQARCAVAEGFRVLERSVEGVGLGAAEGFAIGIDDASGEQTAEAAPDWRGRPSVQGHEHGRPPDGGPPAARTVGVAQERPIPIGDGEFAARGVTRRGDEAKPTAQHAAAPDRPQLGIAVAAVDQLVAGGGLEAREIPAGDEVHHAGDGVGAVGGGGAVGQHLDALQRDGRDHVHVHQQLRLRGNGVRRPGDAPAVQQHQRTARPKAADVDSGAVRTGPGLELIRFPVRALGKRQALDEVDGRRRSFQRQGVPLQRDHRQRRVLRHAFDVRAGDDQLLNRRIVRRIAHFGQGRCRNGRHRESQACSRPLFPLLINHLVKLLTQPQRRNHPRPSPCTASRGPHNLCRILCNPSSSRAVRAPRRSNFRKAGGAH